MNAAEQARLFIARRPVIAFLLQFDKQGAPNYGATGLPEEVAKALEIMLLIEVWYYKPRPGSPRAPKSRRRNAVPRRYRKVSIGMLGKRMAELLREALRNRNLAYQDGLADGRGRVAMDHDFKTRRKEVQAAALAAYDSWLDEIRTGKLDHLGDIL